MHVCKSTTIPETRLPAVQHNGFLDNRRGCPHLVSHFDRVRRGARLKMLPVMRRQEPAEQEPPYLRYLA